MVGTITEFLYVRYNTDPDHDTNDMTQVGLRAISGFTMAKLVCLHGPGFVGGCILWCLIGVWFLIRIPIRIVGALVKTKENHKKTKRVDEIEL